MDWITVLFLAVSKDTIIVMISRLLLTSWSYCSVDNIVRLFISFFLVIWSTIN